MQQTFQCYRCGAQNYVGQPMCWNCRSLFQWNCPNCRAPVQNTMAYCPNCSNAITFGGVTNLSLHIDEQEGPSMHIIPLEPRSRTPVILYVQDQLQLPAIAKNGRLAWLTATTGSEKAILARIKERYPKEKYRDVRTYLCCGVNIQHLDSNALAFIFEVWGFWETMKELDQLYYMIDSLSESTVGDAHWNQVVQYFTSDAVRTWINSLIDYLKEQLQWKDYVAQVLKKF
jgi:hypothetical protein